jgi:hypothetical protein
MINTQIKPAKSQYSDEDIIWHLRDVWYITGKIPTQHDFSGINGRPSINTFRYRFGSFSNAKEAAGYYAGMEVSHIWMVPSSVFDGRLGVTICDGEKGMTVWNKYEIQL